LHIKIPPLIEEAEKLTFQPAWGTRQKGAGIVIVEGLPVPTCVKDGLNAKEAPDYFGASFGNYCQIAWR